MVRTVMLAVPTDIFNATIPSISDNGTLTFVVIPQNGNTFWAGDPTGLTAIPSFRGIVVADLPQIPLDSKVTGVLPVANGGTGFGTAMLGNRLMWSANNGIQEAPLLSDGQLFIGSSIGPPVAATLTPGYGISIVNHHGSITIATNLPLVNLTSNVIGTLGITNGGTGNTGPFTGNQVIISTPTALVEAGNMLDGTLLIGRSGLPPVPAHLTAGSGMSIITGPGSITLNATGTCAPGSKFSPTCLDISGQTCTSPLDNSCFPVSYTFNTLSVSGTTFLGTSTVCNNPLDSSCLAISNQACPAGPLSANCIPTSGLVLHDLTVGMLTILNSTQQLNVNVINGTAFSTDDLFVNYITLGHGMICTGNASISPSCVDISNKDCPGGHLQNACFPPSITFVNITSLDTLHINQLSCPGGSATVPQSCFSIDSKTCALPVSNSCLPTRIATVNGIVPNPGTFDFGVLVGAGLSILPGTNQITLANTGILNVSLVTAGNGEFLVGGSPVASNTGTLTLTTAVQSAHTAWLGPLSGSPAQPSFRLLDATDLPVAPAGYIYLSNGTSMVPTNLTGSTGISIVGGIISNTGVTSVGLNVPTSILTVSPATVTTTGVFNVTLVSQSANTFFAAPNGIPGTPQFRLIVAADLPSLGTDNVLYDAFGPTNLTTLVQQRAVTSVGLSLPSSIFSVSGSPVGIGPSGGTLSAALIAQQANLVFASPVNASGTPTFRNLTLADIPPVLTSVGLSVPSEWTVTNTPLTGYGGTITVGKAVQPPSTFYAGPTVGSPAVPSFRNISTTDFSPLGMTDGQLIIGYSGGAPVLGTLQNGSNIVITNTPGGILISASINVSAIGTVHSVDMTVPSILTVSGGPITTYGTFAVGLATQTGNSVFASPANGSTGAPTFRSLVLADLPVLATGQLYIGQSGITAVSNLTAGTGIIITNTGGITQINTTTSVGLSITGPLYTVSNSPVTNIGTLTATLNTQSAHAFFVGPSTGSPAQPTFRSMALSDMPALSDGQLYIGSGGVPVVSSLSAGSGITITLGMGTLTVSSVNLGTVTSVGLTLPTSVFAAVANSPITSSGTLNATFIVQPGNTVFAGPNGASGLPVFRFLAAADVPSLDASKIGTGTLPVSRGGTGTSSLTGNSIMASNAAGTAIVELPALLNNQVFLGNTSGTAPVATTLVAGANVVFTQTTGSLTISTIYNGTDTSVGLALPVSVFSVTNSPVTTSGVLTGSFVTQLANTIFAAPNGSSGVPTFRSLVAADVPSLDASKITTGTLPIARGGTNSATALANNRIMVSLGGAIVEAAALTNGQILIGSTGGAPAAATLTAGTGISITNSAGGISVANTGVTSVALTAPAAIFSVAGSPVTTTGTLAISLATQLANLVWAGPITGAAATPTFRSLVVADIPSLSTSILTSGTLPVARGGTNTASLTGSQVIVSNAGGSAMVEAGAMTNGQLVIGSTGSVPTVGSITAGTGVSVTLGAGTIQVANTGVTSVGLALPLSVFAISSSPVTTTGTLTGSFVAQSGNSVFASPANGSSGSPTFRSLVAADVPSLDASKLTTGTLPVARGGTGTSSLSGNAMIASNAAGTALVELPQLLNGQIFVGNSTGGPVATTLVAGSNIVITTGPGSIIISTPAQNGTDSSVGLALPASVFSISGSPVTTSGVLTGAFVTQSPNSIFAGPASGGSAVPAFRSIVLADLPSIPLTTGVTGILPAANGGTNSNAALVNNRIMVSSSGSIVEASALTNGQLLIGSTGGAPVAANIAAGTGISVVNSAGGITISSTLAGGTVTSVNMTVPSALLTVTGGPITSAGTFTLALASQSANSVFAAPNGSSGSPTFRSLVIADLPTSIPNANLAFSSVTVSPGTALSGGGTVSLGGTITLGLNMATLAIDATPLATNYVLEYNSTSGTHYRALISSLPVSLMSATGILAIAHGGTNSGTALVNNRIMVSSGGSIVEAGALTNGQFLIGTTGGAPSAGTITAGTGISVVTGAGTVTVANTGVTSVALAVPSSLFMVSGSPVTTTGTFSVTLSSQLANLVFASPNGSAGTPTFRSLVIADITSGTLPVSMGGTGTTSLTGKQIIVSNVGGTALIEAGAMTNGQLLIGSTGATPSVSSLSAGTGISITNGAGTISLANTGVTSVALALPGGIFSVSGSPVTTTGTLTGTLVTQPTYSFFAGPSSGGAATPTFRNFTLNDLIPLGMANGQVVIGSSGGAPIVSTLTAGTGISIANTAGTITISNTGSGTVTSVGMTVPSILSVSGSPITTSGTLALTLASQTANTIFVAPDGSNGTPTFRSMSLGDLPRATNGQIYIGTTGGPMTASTIGGTTNQVIVTSGAGSIILSTPQNIHTAATPTFASISHTATTNQITLGTTNTVTISSTAPAASRTYTIADAGANANFVLDTGGALTITNSGSTSNVLTKTGSTTASWQSPAANTPFVYEVSATTTATTTSSSLVLMTSMTSTPASGQYHVHFSASCNNGNDNNVLTYAIFVGGSIIAHSQRTTVASDNDIDTMHTMAKVTVNGSQAVEIRWSTFSGSTISAFQRSMSLFPCT